MILTTPPEDDLNALVPSNGAMPDLDIFGAQVGPSTEDIANLLGYTAGALEPAEPIVLTTVEETIEERMSRAALTDQTFQDAEEGFDAEGEPGDGKVDGEASIFSARMRLKKIQAGELDGNVVSGVKGVTLGFREDKLVAILKGQNVVSVDTMGAFITDLGYDQDSGEIAIQGAGFRYDGVAYVRDPKTFQIFDTPEDTAKMAKFEAELAKSSDPRLVDDLLRLANDCGLQVAQRLTVLSRTGWTRKGTWYEK